MKKDFLKAIKYGLLMGVIAMTLVCAGFYVFIKAWQSSSTGLPIDTSSPSALYVDSNETLTAAKRNSLVQRSTWVDVLNTDTINFDINCERRAKIIASGSCSTGLWTSDFVWASTAAVGRHNGMRYIDNTNKTKIYKLGAPATYCSISIMQKRCP